MSTGDATDCPEPARTRPPHVPAGAIRVRWGKTPDPGHREAANRYGVVNALLTAGVDADRIQVFHDEDEGGVHWVVALDGERTAVLTDDTEQHVVHMEGPWPFEAVLIGPAGARSTVGYSIEALKALVITWYTEAAGAAGQAGLVATAP